jgi:hypothetical protein
MYTVGKVEQLPLRIFVEKCIMGAPEQRAPEKFPLSPKARDLVMNLALSTGPDAHLYDSECGPDQMDGLCITQKGVPLIILAPPSILRTRHTNIEGDSPDVVRIQTEKYWIAVVRRPNMSIRRIEEVYVSTGDTFFPRVQNFSIDSDGNIGLIQTAPEQAPLISIAFIKSYIDMKIQRNDPDNNIIGGLNFFVTP